MLATRPSMISSSRNRMVTVVAFLASGLPICGPRGTGRQRHYNEPFAELLRKDRGRVTKLEIASESRATSARTGAMIRPATRREEPHVERFCRVRVVLRVVTRVAKGPSDLDLIRDYLGGDVAAFDTLFK